MFQTKFVEKIKTHILCSVTFFPENRAFYGITWEIIVERGRPHMTVWRMRTACWITTATHTHSEYVTLIAFPRQKWLRERSSSLHLYVRWLYCYCIMLPTFLYGSNLLELCNVCGSHICGSEVYCLPQRNDIECSRDVLTFGGVCYSQS